MKNKSLFPRVIFIAALCVLCLAVTIAVALFIGSFGDNMFNFTNFDFTNMPPVILIGGFAICIVLAIEVLFLLMAAFKKLKIILKKTKK